MHQCRSPKGPLYRYRCPWRTRATGTRTRSTFVKHVCLIRNRDLRPNPQDREQWRYPTSRETEDCRWSYRRPKPTCLTRGPSILCQSCSLGLALLCNRHIPDLNPWSSHSQHPDSECARGRPLVLRWCMPIHLWHHGIRRWKHGKLCSDYSNVPFLQFIVWSYRLSILRSFQLFLCNDLYPWNRYSRM
jgi:hypothetical protein